MKISFNYGEERICLPADEGVHKIDENLSVEIAVKEIKEYNAKEWVAYFKNNGNENSKIISDILDCDSVFEMDIPEKKRSGCMPKEEDLSIISMNGMVDGIYYHFNDEVSATEYGFNREYLEYNINQNKVHYENTRCLSSEKTMPFFDVCANNKGYILAIGWTGSWKADFERVDEGVSVKTGLQKTCFYLKSGEEIRTSSTLVMEYGENEDKYNKFRSLMKKHYSSNRESLMCCEMWGGTDSEIMIKRIKELKEHGIKFEELWIDAGWYGESEKCVNPFESDWWGWAGDWRINQRIHPNLFEDVRDAAKVAGMDMMLWFEPERILQNRPMEKEHPEWFMKAPKGDGFTVSRIIRYDNEDAFNYIFNLLSDYIERLNMKCYRQDFNTSLNDYFDYNDEENRVGITEIKHIMGMYRLWDALLEKFPHLVIDNCSGGGRRFDIETMRRSVPFFRSDYQCAFNAEPEVLQSHNSNSSKYFPFMGCTTKTKSDDYAVRSSYSSSWGGAFYNAIFQEMNEEDFKWAAKATEEYLRIRKYFSCDFYNLGSDKFDSTSWAIWQYYDKETDSGIVMAFRRKNSPFDNVTLDLKGLNGDYIFESLNDGETFEGDKNLKITLPEKRSSVIFEYKKKSIV